MVNTLFSVQGPGAPITVQLYDFFFPTSLSTSQISAAICSHSSPPRMFLIRLPFSDVAAFHLPLPSPSFTC